LSLYVIFSFIVLNLFFCKTRITIISDRANGLLFDGRSEFMDLVTVAMYLCRWKWS